MTACTTVALLGILVVNWRAVDRSVLLSAPFIGCVLYLGWIFLFQNVVHKSRHVLPLLPFLTLIPAFACAQIATHGSRFFRLVVIAFFCCYGYVTLHLVRPAQKAYGHRSDTPISRGKKKSDALHIASVPLIKYYLASQALRAVYLPVRGEDDLHALDALDDTAELVGHR